MPSLDSRQQRAAFAFCEALGSSLDLQTALDRAYPLLTQLVPVDYGALGVCTNGRPADYRWTVLQLPAAFFSAYAEMAPHDFVRESVSAQVNVVLRDEDMISRAELERNMMYQRARSIGVPIEQVMAVMLHIDERWQSGLSLYRERRRAFSVKERSLLQRLTPMIVNTVRSCSLFGVAADASSALDCLLARGHASLLITSAAGVEILRSVGAARLIDQWFAPHERRACGLPEPLARVLERCVRSPLLDSGATRWALRGSAATLEVEFVPLGCGGAERKWILLFQERPHAAQLPPSWAARLTEREREIVAGVLRGWDNQLIAAELSCAQATVKKHLQHVFEKLGVESRTALVVRAANAE